MTEKNLCLDEIVSIEKIGKRHTYDFNMPTGCFIAQDFLVHNSDVCIVLNWEWVKGEFNVTVEKNRHGRTGKFRVDFEPQYSRFSNYTPEPDMGVHTD